MKTIKVTVKQLEEIRQGFEDSMEPFKAANEYGFPGFAGGLDHIDQGPWHIAIVDRGMSGGGGDRDHSTKFVVPKRLRGRRNRYVSVIVEGSLDGWTGPNPEKKPEALRLALERAAMHRSQGKTAYPVLIEEILEEDL